MVALNKTYRKPLTPDRSAKDSGRRFYSAEISRWLSRDPVKERPSSLQSTRAKKQSSAFNESLVVSDNPYVGFLNNPISFSDYLGLIAVAGACDPFSHAQVQAAIQGAYDASIANVQEPFKAAIAANWNNMTFTCKDNSSPDCKVILNEETGEFATRRGFCEVGVLRDVVVTMSGTLADGTEYTSSATTPKLWYTEATLCPCNMLGNLQLVGPTGFHEAAHAVGWGGPYDDDDNAKDNLPPNKVRHPDGWVIPGEGAD